MNKILTIILIGTTFATFAQGTPTKDIQMKAAVLAAPEEKREGAKIYGYDNNNNFITLQEGTNDMICITDDPSSPGVNIACYYKGLDEFYGSRQGS